MITLFLRKQHIAVFIAIFYTLILLIWSVFFQLKERLNIVDIIFFAPPSINIDGIWGIVIKGLIVAPLIETLVFQRFVYYLFTKISYLNNKNILICILSGVLFGLSHYYSLYYIILAVIIGFVLMYAYLIHIKQMRKSFWIVVVIHFLLNLSALIKEVILLS
jgi:hypothetical protein